MEYQSQKAQGKELVDFEIARFDKLREISFSTKLIGRDKELNQLKELLNKTKQGQGSLAFVFGEPGIGKSRLVDELRGSIHSLNGLFCGGKCYQYEFRTPYKVFSEAIEAYIEKIKRLSQKEREAHVKRIKENLGELGGEVVKISPSIIELIGQPPKLAELEPDKEQIRFLITITDFLSSLSTLGSPLLMFLDDLQWADDGSLEILERFAEKLSDSSTLLIVSYRDTEVDRNHPLSRLIKKLSEEGVLLFNVPVKSFFLPETSQMVSQILLEKQEQVIPLASELQERAKGNPFFTLELLHSLVDAGVVHLQGGSYAYDLEKLKKANLPTTIVDAVIKRMKDLSEDAHKILSYASVMGREINFELLADIASKPTELILNSIEDGIQNQLLYRDVTGKESVFFMHDRIREAFYERVPREDLPPLHKQIAEALEEDNKDDLGSVLYELAHHFTRGQVGEKALEYSLRAADKAKMAYAYTQAVELYSNALNLMPEEERASGSQRWIQIKEDLGDVYRMVGKFDESIESLRECEKFLPKTDRVRRAQVLNKIGEAIFDKGDNLESAKCLEEALRVLGERTPKTVVGLYLGILKEFSLQMLQTYFYSTMVKKEYTGNKEALITANLCHRIAHVYYNIDVMKMLHLALKAFNIYEAKVGPCSELAYMHGTMGPVWGSIPWFSRAFRDIDFGLRMCQKLGDTLREGCTYAYLCMILYEVNKTKEAIEYGEKSIAMLKKLLGEFWALGVASSFVIYASIHNGEIQRAFEINKEVSDIFNKVKAAQTNGWVLLQRSIVRCFRGDVDEGAIADLKQAKTLLEQAQDKPSIMQTIAYLGFIHFRREEYGKAKD
ncbi:MAG: AAA family ATPase, partial [Candidatus Omnitrophica bacterium]|nr:AAA family ATPase [Candidatus Omnitrophota bacterium]